MSERRRVLVTGGSQGIGFAIADAFAAGECDVAICGRTEDVLRDAAERLRARHPDARIEARRADVAREDDVDALIAGVVDALGGLDVLVANAGVYGPKGAIEDVDWEAWVEAIRVNLLGVVYCARRALPALRRSARGKIVILSGGGATKPLPNLSAYAASKAGVVRFGETLAEELRPAGIDVNMVAPGALNTRLLDEVLAAGPEVVGEAFYASSLRQREQGGTPLEVGAALCAFLGSRDSDGITGKLISAPWDPWQRFAAERERLEGDVYTLRRIVPEERGWSW
ncbi:MAG TPA: SDR family oxidoreductase [Candidatus Elarobacter sp.]|nr:SDR family oxidoreductase [Candidatus Elarobacter sp.]